MKKNGRTVREDITIVKRGLKEFDKILPGQMKQVFNRSILNAGMPYIAVVLSAAVLNELTGAKRIGQLVLLSGSAVLVLFLLTLWKNAKDARIAVGFSHLFSGHEICLTNRTYTMPYEELEKKEFKKLRDDVSGSIQVSGAGMASLYWDMDVVFTNSFSTIIAIELCLDFMRQIVKWDLKTNGNCLHSLSVLAVMALLVAVCAFISCKMTSRRFDVDYEVFENGAKYIRYGEYYTMQYLPDENVALDARIYDQEELILRESQDKCYTHFAEGKRNITKAVNRFDGIRLSCISICGIAVYLMIGKEALAGAIGCGSIVMMYAAVTMMINSLSDFAQILTDLRNNNVHLLNYFRYVDLPQEQGEKEFKEKETEKVQEQEVPQNVQKQEEQDQLLHSGSGQFQSLEIDHVSFQYPESEEWILKDVDLTITAGEKIALVGENGSGKTTLIKLICRLYHPSEGEIRLNGKDIYSYEQGEYMEKLSTVFQDFALFAFSIARNVAADMNYDTSRVELALEEAGLKEKVDSLPGGIEQTLFHDYDEAGTDLSGGEAQKLAIARAIYKDADLMILDEPTAALDPYAECEIYENFVKITEGKTIISISHRLSSCRLCDRIIVLDHGQIIQAGSHEELVGEGKYQEMWNAQAKYYK